MHTAIDPTAAPFSATRALAHLTGVAACALLTACAWGSGLKEEGYMLDARLWRSEVAAATRGHWPADGWYRLRVRDGAVEVSAADPRDAAASTEEPRGGDYFVRIPGEPLQPGLRPGYRHLAAIAHPQANEEYQLAFGKTRFGFVVEEVQGALTYTIQWRGASHRFALGLAGDATQVLHVADLDGDGQPDFIVDVAGQTYLLLSSESRPGSNPPAAELWAARSS